MKYNYYYIKTNQLFRKLWIIYRPIIQPRIIQPKFREKYLKSGNIIFINSKVSTKKNLYSKSTNIYLASVFVIKLQLKKALL